MSPATAPYSGLAPEDWAARTEALVGEHPLTPGEIVEVTLQCWDWIFDSRIGPGFQVGEQLFPKPQIMGFLLHELIALEFARRYEGVWRGEQSAGDKDLVHIPDDDYSVEIKTSSHASRIFGNRSYAQKGTGKKPRKQKKNKTGYYVAVNFEKFKKTARPSVRRIRFGWIDESDWTGQAAATGQQASLSTEVEEGKLLVLYEA